MQATTALDGALVRRILVSSVVGTAIEWYDFFLYATASALVFNKLFFPSFDPVVGTIAAFGTFAVGYLARPLGAVFFGHFGDRIGRKIALVTTLMIMGIATALIVLLPPTRPLGSGRPRHWWPCVSFRVARWAANGAARRSWSWRPRRRKNAAFMAHSRKPAFR